MGFRETTKRAVGEDVDHHCRHQEFNVEDFGGRFKGQVFRIIAGIKSHKFAWRISGLGLRFRIIVGIKSSAWRISGLGSRFKGSGFKVYSKSSRV